MLCVSDRVPEVYEHNLSDLGQKSADVVGVGGGARPPRRVSPSPRIGHAVAFTGYTEAAGKAAPRKVLGTVGSGKLEDLVMISEDPLRASAEELLSMRVLATFRGGQLV